MEGWEGGGRKKKRQTHHGEKGPGGKRKKGPYMSMEKRIDQRKVASYAKRGNLIGDGESISSGREGGRSTPEVPNRPLKYSKGETLSRWGLWGEKIEKI